MNTKELESLDYKPKGITGAIANPEQPNQTLMIIEEIEGLLTQANEKMYELPLHPFRSKAIEEIDVLNKITVGTELKKAFE